MSTHNGSTHGSTRNDRHNEEFDMLLNEVLEELANPEPTTKLQEKVMMRLRLAQTIPDGLAAPRARALRSTSRRPVFQSVPESQGIFASLSNSLRDLVWPKRLPPLVLESRPVAVIDRMAQRRSFASTALAAGLHAAAILLIVFLVGSPLRIAAPVKPAQLTALVAEPPPFPRSSRVLGGGGGQRGPAQVSRGAPPRFSEQQLVPPKASPMERPKIAVVPSIDVQQSLKMPSALPNIGMANAPDVGVSMGNGSGSGIGSGNGNGMGPGSGGNTGGGVRQVGGGVSAPVEIYRVEPEFSEEARRAKLSGDVLVNLWVDRTGHVTHVSVLKGLGMGLDEKAVEAVKQFRFKPAMEDGKPVTVEMNIVVEFQIF